MDTISFSSDQVSKQILVVEDDYDIGDIVENYLKKNGFQVVRATNGQQAIELHANEPYRVCRRVNILRDYPDDKIKIYPRN